jgi:hypothetical protein
MSVIKFDKQKELEILLAKIILETGFKLTKKELLELIFDIGIEDYAKIISEVKRKKSEQEDTLELRYRFIDQFSGIIELNDDDDDDDPKSIWKTEIEE